MEITFKKPQLEPRFIATVYTRENQSEVYRVNIGKEATDTGMDNDVMPIGNYVAQSGFLEREGIERWVKEQVSSLRRVGKRVEFDQNTSYLMCKALEELAEESPITV